MLGKRLALRAAQRSPLMVAPCTQEEAAKSLLAEFNLGCDVQHTGHVYRVYVNTFLGFGGNFARQRYEELVLNQTYVHNRYRCSTWGCLGIAQWHRLLCATLSLLDFSEEPPVVDNSSYSHAGSSWVPAGAWAGTWHNGIALVRALQVLSVPLLLAFPLPVLQGLLYSSFWLSLLWLSLLLQHWFIQHIFPLHSHLQLSPALFPEAVPRFAEIWSPGSPMLGADPASTCPGVSVWVQIPHRLVGTDCTL